MNNYFKNSIEFLSHWNGLSLLKKNQLVEQIIFGRTLHYATQYVSPFWYMTSPKDESVVTELNIKNYVYDIRHAWTIAEEMGIALVPQTACDDEVKKFHWYALDLTSVRYRGIIELEVKNDSGISRPLASEAICMAGIISKLELESE